MIKTEEGQTSVKLEDASPTAQIKAEETQQSASQPARPEARVTKRSRETSAEDTESPVPSKRQRTDGRKKATAEGVQKRRRAPSPRKKVGGKKKKDKKKKKKKTSGRPPKPPATDPSTWRQSRVPFFDTICATAAMKEYRLTPHDLLDLSYDEERSKNGSAYWNPMKLYKTRDVEYRAWRKHGGPEGWEWKLNRLREMYTKKHPGTPFTIPIWDFVYTKKCPCGAYIFSGSLLWVDGLCTPCLNARTVPEQNET